MVRPVTLQERPAFLPYVCIICGLGGGPDREYFIDLGFDLEMHFQPVKDGSPYLCNECFGNVVRDATKLIQEWNNQHATWDGPNAVQATYEWQKQIDLSTVEMQTFGELREPEPFRPVIDLATAEQRLTGFSPDADANYSDSESDDAVDESDLSDADDAAFKLFFN